MQHFILKHIIEPNKFVYYMSHNIDGVKCTSFRDDAFVFSSRDCVLDIASDLKMLFDLDFTIEEV